jgi:hypothetical protein
MREGTGGVGRPSRKARHGNARGPGAARFRCSRPAISGKSCAISTLEILSDVGLALESRSTRGTDDGF